MNDDKGSGNAANGVNIASIDIGSHTARLLIARRIEGHGLFQPLIRKRAYIRLAEGFDDSGKEIIRPEAVDRTIVALRYFASMAEIFDVHKINAVATGVMRRAANRETLINLIYEQTGIKTTIVSGEKEARLTGEGALHCLDINRGPLIIFDLGGGSTEFIFINEENTSVRSVPLGAMLLTQRFLTSDPPEIEELEAIKTHVNEVLEKAFPENAYTGNDYLMAGTGGTVTTLSAMIHHIEIKNISPGRMNGLILRREGIEDLFTRIKTMAFGDRLKLPGMDQGRADVILAGSVVVISILHFFKIFQMVVSLSDLLEGILIDYLQGEGI